MEFRRVRRLQGKWLQAYFCCYITNVYAPCSMEEQKLLWGDLLQVVFSNRGNWCIVGDFKKVRSVEERQGCRVVTVGIDEFNKFIDDSELVDLPFNGKAFSWLGPENRRSWLERPCSHSALAERCHCMRKLKEVCQNAPCHGDVGYSLLVKLKTTKAFLKRWNREEFGNIGTKVENPEKLVDELDTLGIARELNVTDLDLKRRCQAELWKALR
ncbi:hypothetical protein GOBAR_DD35330 [Gossypium barbadense]|nr:hypothetical protein GOBAR_DD35330 [Gossypium barbadense]